jgi:hypothetical protein
MLQKVKAYLKITWDDEDTAITDLITRGKKKLEELAGAEPDFDTEGLARALLFDYCRYAYNNASEYFEENFQKEILRLQLMTGVSLLPVEEEIPVEDEEDEN